MTLISAGAAATATVAGSPYGITASGARGGTFDPANYTISYVDGHLTVTPAPLVLGTLAVKPDDVSKAYGQIWTFADNAFTASGLQNGETIGAVTLASAGAAASAGVGSYTITASNARGGTFIPANYTIRYLTGTLTVNPAALLVSADSQSRAVGAANPALTWQAVGLVNGDTLSGGLVTTATPASVAGDYAITQGSLAASSNYVLTYRGADLTVVWSEPLGADRLAFSN